MHTKNTRSIGGVDLKQKNNLQDIKELQMNDDALE
jgi:hypothetical protein